MISNDIIYMNLNNFFGGKMRASIKVKEKNKIIIISKLIPNKDHLIAQQKFPHRIKEQKIKKGEPKKIKKEKVEYD